MHHLHREDKVAHGDLKAENVLLSDDNRLVLIDFGHSEKINAKIAHVIGTHGYQAPEVLSFAQYGIEQADIYALSVTLFTILFQDVPFGKKATDQGKVHRLYGDFKK